MNEEKQKGGRLYFVVIVIHDEIDWKCIFDRLILSKIFWEKPSGLLRPLIKKFASAHAFKILLHLWVCNFIVCLESQENEVVKIYDELFKLIGLDLKQSLGLHGLAAQHTWLGPSKEEGADELGGYLWGYQSVSTNRFNVNLLKSILSLTVLFFTRPLSSSQFLSFRFFSLQWNWGQGKSRRAFPRAPTQIWDRWKFPVFLWSRAFVNRHKVPSGSK